MDHARVELRLVRAGWSRGVRVAGAVGGPVLGVAIDPRSLTVNYSFLTHKRVRRLSVAATPDGEPESAALPQDLIVLRAGMRVRGSDRAIGTLSRVWVRQPTGEVTHLLVRTPDSPLRAPRERILTAALIHDVQRHQVLATISRSTVRELPLYRADVDIAADIERALDAVLTSPRARRGAKVRVDDGHVALVGEVDTTEQARLAARVVAVVSGVRGITIDLVAQDALAAAVEKRIAPLVAVSSNGHGPVQVLAEHGIVYLEGSVTNADARTEIERVALGVTGARVVVNNLQTNGEPPTRGPGTGPLVRNR